MQFILALLTVASMQETPASAPTTQPAASQPTSRPAPAGRTPEQARIFSDLLRESDRFPNRPHAVVETDARARSEKDENLIPEGMQAEKSIRLIKVGDHYEMRLPDEKSGKALSLELLPNRYLESMEQDAGRGISQFIVTYEVTAYRGRNFGLVRAYRRQIDNGNLRP